MTRPRNILIVRTGAMGDVLHGMPAVAALRAAMPHLTLGWVIEPRWEPLLCDASGDMPLLQRIHRAETKAWSKAPFSRRTLQSVRALRRELRLAQYDLCVDLQGSVRSSIIARLAGAPRIIGSATPREMPARWLYTGTTAVQEPHVIDQAAEILSAAIGQALQPVSTPLPLHAAATPWCDALVGQDTRPIALLAPSAGWGAKQWPAERYGAVAAALVRQGMRVLVNAVPGVDPLAQQVVATSQHAAESIPCSLPQLITLMRRTSLFLGGDTGPLHLAAACQVPVVALFGPTDPRRTGPWGTRSVVLRNASSATDHRRHRDAEEGLMKISVEDVLEAVRTLRQGPA